MILINLLPEEFIERKIKIPVPLKEIALVILLLLFLVWGFVISRNGSYKKQLSSLELEMKALTPDLTQSEALIKEMNMELIPKKTFIDDLKKPEAQWDRILNLISDAVQDGVWFTSLNMNDASGLTIKLEGFAKPVKNKSPIGIVGEFVTESKRLLEGLINEGPVPGNNTLQVETFTQQKDLEPVKLTQFTVTFEKPK